MRQFARRQPVAQQIQNQTRHEAFPAPTRGWVSNENLATPQGLSAKVLENWFPETDGVRLRGGATQVARIDDPVTAMFRFRQSGQENLFAASATDIYDISALNPSTAPAADVTGQTDGYYSTLQMATAGGEFLYAFNEADAPQLFDGTSWTQITGVSTPAITGVTTTLLRHGWVYRERIFMVERDSLKAWYLPVESVGGAAGDISLAGVFQQGGELFFGGTWSLDAGDGVDDKCVFVSTLGEVAVYEGADPGDPNDWRLVGVYQAAAPVGKNAHMRAGGDFLIATVEGIVPLTAIIQKDPAALSLSAVSRPIEPDWKRAAASRSAGADFEMLKWPEKSMALISLPYTATTTPQNFVINLETGAWAKFTGWDIQCMSLYVEDAYFGSLDGDIYLMEAGGSDDGMPYVCRVSYFFSDLGRLGAHKTPSLARASFVASLNFRPKLSVASNYTVAFPTPPDSAVVVAASLWDSALWDVDVWDGGVALENKPYVTTRWRSVAGPGISHSPQVQVTVGNTPAPDAKLVMFDLVFEDAELVI